MKISSSEYMKNFYDSIAESYDKHTRETNPDVENFHKKTADLIASLNPKNILDLGCGTGFEIGYILQNNPNIDITALDISSKMLEELSKKYPNQNIKLINQSYFEAELGRNLYDCVISVMTLHHFTAESKQGLYKKIHNALHQDGCYIETDFIVETEDEEIRYLKQAIENDKNNLIGYGYYDIPLSIEHQKSILHKVGFTKIDVLPNVWSNGRIRTIITQKLDKNKKMC